MTRPLFLLLLPLAVGLAACAPSSSPSDGVPHIVVTTSIWADVVDSLDVDDSWTIDVLVPRGADPHDFTPSAAQVAAIRKADLVIANGLGLEEGLNDALVAAEADGVTVLRVAELLDPRPLGSGGEGAALDPHVWLDPIRVSAAIPQIAAEIETAVPGIDLTSAAAAASADMLAVADDMEATLEGVTDRRLVTNHDALGYFAERFGFEVIGTVIPGGSTIAEPSSKDLADLIERMKDVDTRAIFVDAALPRVIAQAVAEEFGGEVTVVELHVGSLTPEGEASTLAGLLRSNATLVAEALER